MRDREELAALLAAATVDEAVFALRPDYRALLVAVDGLAPDPYDEVPEQLLQAAEAAARQALAERPVEELPHVAAWREAYRALGAKPQRTRNSLEALLRRVEGGLPRVNPLTDVYNAVSVSRQVPLGGEDLDRYRGAPRLVRATGTEVFDTTAGGEPVVEHPDAGEVVWCDDDGVTCRRWNWRQGRRTALSGGTTAALFVVDALAPLSDEELTATGDELVAQLTRLGDDVRVARRVLAAAGG